MAVSRLGILIIVSIILIAILALILGIYFGTRPTSLPYTVLTVNSGGLVKVDQFGDENQGTIQFTWTEIGAVIGFEIIPSVNYPSVSNVSITLNRPGALDVILQYASISKLTFSTISKQIQPTRSDPFIFNFKVNP